MRRSPAVLLVAGLSLAPWAGFGQTSDQPPPPDPLADQHVLRLPPSYQNSPSQVPTPYGTATPQNTPYPPPSQPSPYGPASRYGGGSMLGNPQQYQQPQVQTPGYGYPAPQPPNRAPPAVQTPSYGALPPAQTQPAPNGAPPIQAQQPNGGATTAYGVPPPLSNSYGPVGNGGTPAPGNQVPSGGLSPPVVQSPLTPLDTPQPPAQANAPPQLGIPNPAVPPSVVAPTAGAPAETPQLASPQQPTPVQPPSANTAGDQPAPAGATPAPGPAQPNANAYAPAPPWPNQWLPAGTAQLQALDKVNAQTSTLSLKVGQSATFGSLTITVKSCMVRPPDQPADAAAFVSVTDSHPDSEGFNGWLLENEPTVSIMQHPIYDLRVTGCA